MCNKALLLEKQRKILESGRFSAPVSISASPIQPRIEGSSE
jgi:hypothetical protein